MDRRLLSLWLPEWSILRQSRFCAAKPGDGADQPIAVIATERGVRRVHTVNAAARARGVRVDLSLADAKAICPDLLTRPHDPQGDQEALERLALWAQAFTPLTAADPPDGLWLDITGCALLWGGEDRLTARLQARLPGARIAIANNASAAWAFARYGESRYGEPRYGESGAHDLAALPIAALGIDAATQRRLRRLGLRRIGDLAALSRGELLAGCGAETLARYDRVRGIAPDIVHFLPAPSDQTVREQHAEPLLTAAQLGGALSRLCHKLCAQLTVARAGMTALTAQFYRVDRRLETMRLGFSHPTRDEAHIIKLLHNGLNQIDPGFGIEAILLEPVLADMPDSQHDWLDPAAIDEAHTLDLLLARADLQRFVPRDSHIPERSVQRTGISVSPSAFPQTAQPRPAVLFARPIPIQVIAEWPDDPPRMILWRHQRYRVFYANGPERIARDWWRFAPDPSENETERIRDYYYIETTEGLRLWVFRAGIYAAERKAGWFIHGIFA
jgi:protein ImuB